MKNLIFILTLALLPVDMNAQYDGATPWEYCFGKNASCGYVGCSDIEVITSSSSPVVAIVKKNGKVIKHAYIEKNSSYTFEIPDGRYQVYFYYGEYWDASKKMQSDECSSLYGGFTKNERVTKDDPIVLKGQIMSYTLRSITGGNFSPKSSDLSEAL
tara:strand:+ start:211 stop:681 length:471 start_codon:yes stop_codon:yes gene_type:complete